MRMTILFTCLFVTYHVQSQTYLEEALLFSRSELAGTARTLGAGGAFSSVGADLGSIAVNPAGIGLYRSNDFSITPGLYATNTESNFLGSISHARNNRFMFAQAGASFTKLFDNKPKPTNSFGFNPIKLKAITFAINYQRQMRFDRVDEFTGYNPDYSAIEYFTSWANQDRRVITLENYPPEMVLANTVDLFQGDSANNYTSKVVAPVYQSGKVVTRGAIDKIDLAFGGNLNDKFYFGTNFGFAILTNNYNYSVTETGVNDSTSYFNYYNLQGDVRTTGLGFTAGFGVIYRPAAWMRLGMAYQLPVFYSSSQTFNIDILADYDTALISSGVSFNPFKYKFNTPMSGTFGSSFYIKQFAFISVDYTFMNYGSFKYIFRDYPDVAKEINQTAKESFTFGHRINAGIEGAYKSLRIRGGYVYSSTPYKKGIVEKAVNETKHVATAGIGYRGSRFYADFAYSASIMKDEKYPYYTFDVKNRHVAHTVLLTLGWKMVPKQRKARAPKQQTAPQQDSLPPPVDEQRY